MRVRKWRIIVLFRDNDSERFNASEFYFEDNILTIIDDGVKRVLIADYIKDITIY